MSDWVTGERDLADDMFKLTMYIVSKTLFGTDMANLKAGADEIGKTIHVVQECTNKRYQSIFIAPDWLPTPNNQRLLKSRRYLDKTIESMIEARKADDSGTEKLDMMSMLLASRYEDGSEMSNQLIMDELITLFVAGHETTSNALSWAFYLLSQHPEVQDKLNDELERVLEGDDARFEHLDELVYTEMVVKEALRLFPPAWTLNTRRATKDIVVNGYFFPKGKRLFVSPFANHRNPKYFNKPDQFNPERFAAENEKSIPKHAYIPFGSGSRVCIGQSFAMMEAKLILASVVRRFKLEACDNTKFDALPQVTLSNKGGMKLRLVERHRT